MSLPRGFTSPPPVASTSTAHLPAPSRLIPSRTRHNSSSSQTGRDSPRIRSPSALTPTIPEAGAAARTSLAPADLARTPSQSHSRPAPSPPARQASGSGTPWNSGPEGSGRASPATSAKSGRQEARLEVSRPAGRSQGSSGYGTRNLESYSARHVAAALEAGEGILGKDVAGDDVWSGVCVRVLPLFNGEGLRAPVEDLNDLVHVHVERTLSRVVASAAAGTSRHANPQSVPLISTDAQSLAVALLSESLTDLISIGCITLSVKLYPPPPTPPLSDAELLTRLAEVWLFFLTEVLPGLESVFWSLRDDPRLQAAVRGARLGRERNGQLPLQSHTEGRIDVRSLALIGFRDQLVLAHLGRLGPLFAELAEEQHSRANSQRSQAEAGEGGFAAGEGGRARSGSGHQPGPSNSSNVTVTPAQAGTPASFPATPLPSGATTPAPAPPPPATSPVPPATGASSAQAYARRRQLVATLASVLTGDDRQAMIEDLLRAMRTGTPANLGRPAPEGALSTDLGRRQSYGSPLLGGESGGVEFDFGTGGGGGTGGPTTRMGRARAGTMDSLEEEELPLPANLAAMRLTSMPPPATLPPIASAGLLGAGAGGDGFGLLPPSAPMSLNPSSATATSQSSAGPQPAQHKEKKRHHFLGGLMKRSHSGDGGRAKGHKDKAKGDAEVVEGIRRSATLNTVH